MYLDTLTTLADIMASAPRVAGPRSAIEGTENLNARPERKRMPIHRCATVEQRIHCETQYFCKHAPISRPKMTRQKNKKLYACLCKNTAFCKGFSSAGISDFSVLRGCKG